MTGRQSRLIQSGAAGLLLGTGLWLINVHGPRVMNERDETSGWILIVIGVFLVSANALWMKELNAAADRDEEVVTRWMVVRTALAALTLSIGFVALLTWFFAS